MDGWVKIGAELDTKQLEKDIKDSEKKLKQYEKEGEQLTKQKLKLDVDNTKALNELQKVDNKINQLNKKIASMEEVNAPEYLAKNIDYTSLIQQRDMLNQKGEEYLKKIDEIKATQTEITKKTQENKQNQEDLNNKLDEMKDKLNQARGFENIKKGINEASDSMTKLLSKVAKWSLAVFSVRGAYSLVRSAISTISGYNEQIATDIEYMRYALASALEPVIKRIVKLAQTLMTYINYIWKIWFGKELFASAKSFEDMKNAASGTANAVKEIRKQLAGFDEMNVLNADGSTNLGGVGGGITAPSIDLANWNDIEIPAWIDWIAKHRDLILSFLTAFAGIIVGIKVVQFAKGIHDLVSGFSGMDGAARAGTTALENFGKAIGTGFILTGLGLIATAIFDLISNWDDMSESEKGAEIALLLLGTAFTILGITIRAAIDTATFGLAELIGVIVAAVTAIAGLVTWLATEEKSIKDVETAEKNLKDAQDALKEATENYSNTLDNYDRALQKAKESAEKLEEIERKNQMTGEDLQKQVDEGKLSYDKMTDAQKEVYKAYWENIVAQQNLDKATENLTTDLEAMRQAQEDEKIATWEAKLAQEAQSESFKNGGKDAQKFKDDVIEAYEKGELSAEQARDIIGKAMSEMSRGTQEAFTRDIPEAIKKGLDPQQYETFGQKLSKFFSGIWDKISGGFKVIGSLFSSGGVTVSSSGYAMGGVTGFAKGGVSCVKPVYCARGSVISQPGRGVPISQAVGGERGHEGIIPLTDAQMMEQLGQTIGRYININLTNITQLDNRQIAREQKAINAQNDFAYNR